MIYSRRREDPDRVVEKALEFWDEDIRAALEILTEVKNAIVGNLDSQCGLVTDETDSNLDMAICCLKELTE